MEEVFLLALLRLVQLEKRSFGLPQAGRLTTVAVGTTGRLRAGVMRINRVGIVVRFAGVGEYKSVAFYFLDLRIVIMKYCNIFILLLIPTIGFANSYEHGESVLI